MMYEELKIGGATPAVLLRQWLREIPPQMSVFNALFNHRDRRMLTQALYSAGLNLFYLRRNPTPRQVFDALNASMVEIRAEVFDLDLFPDGTSMYNLLKVFHT